MARKQFSDSEVIDQIKKGNQQVLVYLFEQNYSSIKKFVLQNSGRHDDVDDLLQEAVIVVWQNALKPEFVLSSQLNTYLYAIVKNLWYKQLKKKERQTNIQADEYDHIGATEDKQNLFDKKVIQSCINEIGYTCKNLLSHYYFDGYNMSQIAEIMGFNNADTAKAKKYQCLKKLQDLVKTRYNKSDFNLYQ